MACHGARRADDGDVLFVMLPRAGGVQLPQHAGVRNADMLFDAAFQPDGCFLHGQPRVGRLPLAALGGKHGLRN